jgi:hypothetical protein
MMIIKKGDNDVGGMPIKSEGDVQDLGLTYNP